jgi:hypothetical protein
MKRCPRYGGHEKPPPCPLRASGWQFSEFSTSRPA